MKAPPEAVVGQAIDAALRKLGRASIVVAGRSGVGKSTLINAVFGQQLVETGQGRPVTQHIQEVSRAGLPVSIFDTRGLELEQFQRTVDELAGLVEARKLDSDPGKHLHVAWLCLSEGSRRVEEGESQVARLLARHMPLVVVITKALADRGFADEVRRLIPEARQVVRVRALPETDDEGNELKPRGLTELVDTTLALLPEAYQVAFASAQVASVARKRPVALEVVRACQKLAWAACMNPAGADTALLYPLQLGMLARLAALFGLPATAPVSKATLDAATREVAQRYRLPGALGTALKVFLPVLGTVASAALFGKRAEKAVGRLGEAYVEAVLQVLERTGGTEPPEGLLDTAFLARLRETPAEGSAA